MTQSDYTAFPEGPYAMTGANANWVLVSFEVFTVTIADAPAPITLAPKAVAPNAPAPKALPRPWMQIAWDQGFVSLQLS